MEQGTRTPRKPWTSPKRGSQICGTCFCLCNRPSKMPGAGKRKMPGVEMRKLGAGERKMPGVERRMPSVRQPGWSGWCQSLQGAGCRRNLSQLGGKPPPQRAWGRRWRHGQMLNYNYPGEGRDGQPSRLKEWGLFRSAPGAARQPRQNFQSPIRPTPAQPPRPEAKVDDDWPPRTEDTS